MKMTGREAAASSQQLVTCTSSFSFSLVSRFPSTFLSFRIRSIVAGSLERAMLFRSAQGHQPSSRCNRHSSPGTGSWSPATPAAALTFIPAAALKKTHSCSHLCTRNQAHGSGGSGRTNPTRQLSYRGHRMMMPSLFSFSLLFLLSFPPVRPRGRQAP